jgi:hypothetical protein
MRRPTAALGAAAVAAAALAAGGGAAGTPLTGTTGPGFTISLKDASGGAVTHLDAGAYSLTVDDVSDEHDFHLSGPGGVDVLTPVEGTLTRTVDLTLVDGTYTFICDAHPTRMRGSFTVGAVTPAPPPAPAPKPARLTLTVTDRAVSLRTAAGGVVRSLAAGRFSIRVVDRSKRQNAHLTGAGIDRKTGIAATGTVTLAVTLKAGTLTVRSDAAKPRLRAIRLTVASRAVS